MNPSAAKLRVAGLTRLSTCDWPGELAATVFCQGCGWDCVYCHNPGLRPAGRDFSLLWEDVLHFLKNRHGLLDAVVFSGGEPTLQSALSDAVEEVRAQGFCIGLHTSGMAPKRLEALLPLLDWVGFDVKAPWADYATITGVENSGEQARQSLQMLLASGVNHEARTTFHPALLSRSQMLTLRDELLRMGVKNYVVQNYRREGTVPNRLPSASGNAENSLPADFGQGFTHFLIR